MFITVSVQEFEQEVECVYKNERFKVRDNGAIYRCARIGQRFRPNDNQWTFGNPNEHTGYMDITSLPVHRIITTAFHGESPTTKHIVDHIDTNKRNNRPENLRWVTRLENILLNPITAKRIAKICGSVEAFLKEPSKFLDKFPDPNFFWMCAVTPQEAQKSLQRMLDWANTDDAISDGNLSDWIVNRGFSHREMYETQTEVPEIIMAMTPGAAQRNWRIPSEFLCCPEGFTGNPLLAYKENLKKGALFCRNDIYSSNVSEHALSGNNSLLFIITVNPEEIKPWGLAQVTFEDGLFIHTSLHKYFSPEGAHKQFTLAQGLEWLGGDSVDDYC